MFRVPPKAFTEKEIALLSTFADQAVIAIENVRLFEELKESLEQQTATSEILGVIASSPTDVQPVFDAIARSARTLCLGKIGAVFRYQDGLIHLAAAHGATAPQAGATAPKAGAAATPHAEAKPEGKK